MNYIPALKDYLNEASLAYKYVTENLNSVYKQLLSSTSEIDPTETLNIIQTTRTELTEKIQGLRDGISEYDQQLRVLPHLNLNNIKLPIDTIRQKKTLIQNQINLIQLPCRNSQELNTEIDVLTRDLNPIKQFVDPSIRAVQVEVLLDNLEKINKPESDLNSLKSLVNNYDRAYNKDTLSKVNQLPEFKQQLDVLTPQLEQINQILDSHKTNFPHRPSRQKHEYNKWLVSNPVIESSEIQILEDECLSSPLVIPTLTGDNLRQMSANLAQIKNRLKNPERMDCSGDTFNSSVAKIQQEYNEFNSEINTLHGELEQSNNTINSLKVSLSNKEHELAEIKIYTKPKIELDDVNSWMKKYLTAKNKQPRYHDLKKASDQVESHKKRLSELEINLNSAVKKSEGIEFNPDCYACQKQPWKIHINDLQKQISDITENLQNSVAVYTSLSKSLPSSFDFNKAIEDFNEMVKKLSLYEEYQLNHTEYNNYVDASAPLKLAISKINQNLQSELAHQNEINVKFTAIQRTISKYSTLLDEIKYCQDNREDWLKQIHEIQSQKIITQKYQELLPKHNKLEKIRVTEKERQQWIHEIKIIDQYDAWQNTLQQLTSTKDLLNNKINNLQSTILKLEQCIIDSELHADHVKQINQWSDWEKYHKLYQIYTATHIYHKIGALRLELNQLEKHTELDNLLSEWTLILDLKPVYDSRLKDIQSLETHQNDLLDIEKKLVIQIKQVEEYEKNTQLKIHLNEAITSLTKNGLVATELIKLTEGYKFWMYREKIIPKIVSDTNKIAHMANVGFEYQLKAQVTLIDKQINISWCIFDGQNQVRVIRNGGFRHFLFGLAFRIALSRLGTIGVNCDQLFLDEGFVGADVTNLQYMPDLLQNILRVYSSILLVSHLDSLKNVCEKAVSIVRFNKLSHIEFGLKKHISLGKYVSKDTHEPDESCTNDPVDIRSLPNISENNSTITIIPRKCHELVQGRQCKLNSKPGTNYCARHSKE